MSATDASAAQAQAQVQAERADLVALLRHVFAAGGRRTPISLLLLLLGSVAEGISILLVIPLLTAFAGGIAKPTRLPLVGTLPTGFTVEAILGGLVALVIAKAFFTRLRTIYTARLLIDLVNAERLRLFTALSGARWEYLSRHRTSDLNHLMSAEVDRLQGGAFNLLLLIQTVLLLAVFLALSVVISVWMTLAALALGLIVLAILRPVRRMATRYGGLRLRNRRMQYAIISEFLAGLKLVKTFNAEGGHIARLSEVLTAMRDEAIGYARISSTSTVVSQVVSAMAVFAIVLLGVRGPHLSLPYLIAFLLILLRSAPQFLAMQNAWQELIVYLPAFRQVRDLQCRAEAMCEPHGQPLPGRVLECAADIRLAGVGFRYPDQPLAALDALSFTIPAGQVTAIVGPSGAGKSTLADLLLGLQSPTSGEIWLDDVRIDSVTCRSWRGRTGYVSQDVFLMHDSIAANLTLARPEATPDELWEALELAQASQFVMALPEGLATLVGERGVRLSGGERQRIALARALLRRPQLLVLDEATSALDWENQQAIIRTIERLRGQHTIVTIAHRPSMIAFADHVVALANGRVIEQGAFADLIEHRGSALRRMFEGERNPGAPFAIPALHAAPVEPQQAARSGS